MPAPIEALNGSAGFMPHGMCYLWQKDILYLHVVSDSVTAIAYYSIPLALLYFIIKRKAVTYHWIFIMFALFILACGTTHLVDIWTIWEPVYWTQGVVKAVTGLISLVTAITLWYIMPDLLTLPSPTELVTVNNQLQSELTERKRYQKKLYTAHSRLKQQLRLSLVSQMNARLQACRYINEARPIIAHYLPRLFPKSSGGLYIHNDSGTMIELAAAWGEPEPAAAIFKQEECWALRQGGMHVARYPNIGTDLPCGHYADEDAKNCICMPLIADGDVIGLLHLRLPDNQNSDEDLDDSRQDVTITSTAEYLSLALANLQMREELEMQSVRDPLTDIYNRRYMQESLDRELARAQRSGEQVAVLMLDIDHFKSVNDTYGHEAGDTVLKDVASFMQSNIRTEDIIARYGGEEFIIIMPGMDMGDACEKTGQLCRQVKSLTFTNRNQRLAGVSLSVGVAIYPADGETGESLLALADAALYHAKSSGRDKVILYSELPG